MPPQLAWELHCFNCVTTPHAIRTWCQITQSFVQLLLPVKVKQGQSGDIATLRERHLAYYMAWEKFHHYCFSREVLIITNHKLLVSIFKKDVAALLQCIQCILLKIHQYKVQIIYKPGPEFFIADWLSQHNHVKGKDKPIKDIDG